jgi:hypothetical protein
MNLSTRGQERWQFQSFNDVNRALFWEHQFVDRVADLSRKVEESEGFLWLLRASTASCLDRGLSFGHLQVLQGLFRFHDVSLRCRALRFRPGRRHVVDVGVERPARTTNSSLSGTYCGEQKDEDETIQIAL